MASEKGRRFSHLKHTQRLRIEKLLKEGRKPQEIADILHVHNSTIYREIHRGLKIQRTTELVDREVYCPDVADDRYQRNLRAKGPDLKIGNDHELAEYIEDKIANERYSPGAVLDKIKEEGLVFSVEISKWTLYSYITKGVFLTITNKSLPRRGKKKAQHRKVRPARLPKGDSIEDRPPEIDERIEPGHWEMDTVISCEGDLNRLLVLTARKTRKEIVMKIPDGTTKSVVAALNRLERKLGTQTFRRLFATITVDNGSEFQDCAGMERSRRSRRKRTHVYYCHPYSSWERGSNENANSMIRRWFPKGTDFSRVSNEEIARVERWINNYPRGILGGKCSENVFQAMLESEGIDPAGVAL